MGSGIGRESGGASSAKNELKPLSVLGSYTERWMKEQVDSLELAKLRDSGLTLREIAARVGVAKTTVLRALRLYAARKGLNAD